MVISAPSSERTAAKSLETRRSVTGSGGRISSTVINRVARVAGFKAHTFGERDAAISAGIFL